MAGARAEMRDKAWLIFIRSALHDFTRAGPNWLRPGQLIRARAATIGQPELGGQNRWLGPLLWFKISGSMERTTEKRLQRKRCRPFQRLDERKNFDRSSCRNKLTRDSCRREGWRFATDDRTLRNRFIISRIPLENSVRTRLVGW